MLFNNSKRRTTYFNSASNISRLKDVSLTLCGPDLSKGWGEEQMQRQWWFPRSLCTRCRSGESADSWRCPPRTSGTGRRGLVCQTCNLGCYKKDFLKKLFLQMSVKLQTKTRCLFIPLRVLSHVSHKVLLPHYKIDDPSKGSRSFKQMRKTLSAAHNLFVDLLCIIWICLSIFGLLAVSHLFYTAKKS